MKRRTAIQAGLAAVFAGIATRAAGQGRAPQILLRNAWQITNIGDIAHAVGMLNLISSYLPGAGVVLWAGPLDDPARALYRQVYPGIEIVEGDDEAMVAEIFAKSDFMLHGSAAGFVAQKHVQLSYLQTSKPFGVFGISLPSAGDKVVALLSQAAFVYFRDSPSLAVAKAAGITAEVMDFGPDSTFAFDAPLNDQAAQAFLADHGLAEQRFMCCLPRYRWTPTWTYRDDRPVDEVKDARNKQMVESDHAPLRDAIIAVVRQAGLRVLICAEDVTQIELGRVELLDKLPDDVKAQVVWRDRFWLPDEAAAIYARSAGVFGNEMHSPILALANGVPAVVCRFAEQTTKGIMWRDIGLGDWLFDLDVPEDVARIVPTVLSIAQAPQVTRVRVGAARDFVLQLYRSMMSQLDRVLPG